jgi:hypothetical protein
VGESRPAFTPDGRYLIVRGRLWRAANPGLAESDRKDLVAELMDARRAVKHHRDDAGEDEAHGKSREKNAEKAWLVHLGGEGGGSVFGLAGFTSSQSKGLSSFTADSGSLSFHEPSAKEVSLKSNLA